MNCTKLYHTTRKSTFENSIKKEGLKPICDRNLKNFPCNDWIHFMLDKNEAIRFGFENNFEKDGFVTLQTDIVDVMNTCKFLSKYEYYSYNEVIATSKIGNIDLRGMIGYIGQKYDCKISPSRLKVVFDSTRQQNKR